MIQSKKGMSPLIATVLLISFAVALGAMIMNWSASVESGHDETEPHQYCDGISLSQSGNACRTDTTLEFGVKNTGNNKISAIRLGITTPNTEYDITVKDSIMISGETVGKTIPFASQSDSVEVKFIPLVQVDGELQTCEEEGFSTSIPTC